MKTTKKVWILKGNTTTIFFEISGGYPPPRFFWVRLPHSSLGENSTWWSCQRILQRPKLVAGQTEWPGLYWPYCWTHQPRRSCKCIQARFDWCLPKRFDWCQAKRFDWWHSWKKNKGLKLKWRTIGMLAMKKVPSIKRVRSSGRRFTQIWQQRQRQLDSLLRCQCPRPRWHQLTKLQLPQPKPCLKRQCLPQPRQFQSLQATIWHGSLSTAQLTFKSLCLKSRHHRQRPKCQLCQGQWPLLQRGLRPMELQCWGCTRSSMSQSQRALRI